MYWRNHHLEGERRGEVLRTMTKKCRLGDTISYCTVTAPGDTNPSDATDSDSYQRKMTYKPSKLGQTDLVQ